MFLIIIITIIAIYFLTTKTTDTSIAPQSYVKPNNANPMYNDDQGWSDDIPKFVRYNIFYPSTKSVKAYCDTFTVIDFETANAFPDSVCQLGIVVVENNKIVDKRSFYIKPPYRHFKNTPIHGITYNKVKNSPSFEEVWKEISPYIDGKIIAAYNLNFDAGCMEALWKCYNIKSVPYAAFDILETSRTQWSRYSSHKLVDITEKLDIMHNAHDALSDAEAAATIQIMANEKGFATVVKSRDFKNAFFQEFEQQHIDDSEALNRAKQIISSNKVTVLDNYKSALDYLNIIIQRNQNSKLVALAYRLYAEVYEICGYKKEAYDCYSNALTFNDKVGVKNKIKKLEKELHS